MHGKHLLKLVEHQPQDKLLSSWYKLDLEELSTKIYPSKMCIDHYATQPHKSYSQLLYLEWNLSAVLLRMSTSSLVKQLFRAYIVKSGGRKQGYKKQI